VLSFGRSWIHQAPESLVFFAFDLPFLNNEDLAPGAVTAVGARSSKPSVLCAYMRVTAVTGLKIARDIE
jgi:hypothetical protein